MSLAAVLACSFSVAAPSSAGAQCVTTLPVTFAFHSPYAGFYRNVLPVSVTTDGPPIHNLTAALYTFAGDLIGRGAARRTIFSSQRVVIRLRAPMQPGRFSLVLFGEPNEDPSCGPKHLFHVVRFRGCTTILPVNFPAKPRGNASDYGDMLTVNVQPASFLLRHVTVSLATFGGQSLGSVGFNAAFGEVSATFSIPGGVQPGGYTVFVRGTIASQPASCGSKFTKTTLRFR